ISSTITIITLFASYFNDVSENDWYYEAVQACEDLGLIAGYGDGTFGPNDKLTYQQMNIITLRCWLLRSQGITDKERVTYLPDGYEDISTGSNNIATRTAAAWELIPKLEGNTNRIENVEMAIYTTAYREEAVSSLVRLLHQSDDVLLTEISIWGYAPDTVENPSIPDYDQISDIYKDEVYEGYQLGIASGYDETGLFKPQNELTRAEFCQMIYNMGYTNWMKYGLENNLFGF
ncbi:MAG: S-layer homology domain-containing protein, partial [Firmicutes bacterium]|nr:S-layer homology domain-containing protein [Bacillota bacterium]